MKKRLYTLPILVLAFAVTACSSKPASQEAATAGDKKESSAKTETTTYQIFRNFNSPEYPADGGPAKPIILDALKKDGVEGVDYKVSLATGDEYLTKLNLLASSGQLPDYFNVDIPTMSKYADEGLILPLDDLIKKAPNIQKVIKQTDLEALKYKGKLYALPAGYRPEPFNGPNTSGFVIRKDWLDNLGLKEPKTLDEFHEVLKAFTLNDPDKNGKNDTYGLTNMKLTNANGNASGSFSGIFGAFGVIPNFWIESGGQLKQGWVLPETKSALALLQAWYKEGLIDPDFPIMDTKQVQEKMINSKAGVYEGSAFDGDAKQPMSSSLIKATPTAKLKVLAPPTGSSGKKGWAESAPAYSDIRAISANVKDPEKLLKLLDWSTGPGFELVTYGVLDQDYKADKEKNKINMLVPSYSELYKRGFSNPVRFLQVVDRRWMADDAVTGMYVTNDPHNLITNKFWKTVPAMLDYPDLNKLWSEYFTKIVTGAWSVDKWDEFVQKYYQQGGQVIEKQVNEEWKKQ